MKKLLTMFFTFLKIGAFTFGGGYAMIPLIESEVVAKHSWIKKEEFLDIIVISQSFPGALAVNSSIFIGYKIGGILGAILALMGSVIPSFFIILIVAHFFLQFRNNHIVNLIFKGISATVPMLILSGVVKLSKSLHKTKTNLIIIALTIISVAIFDIHPVIIIFVCAVFGIIFLKEKVI